MAEVKELKIRIEQLEKRISELEKALVTTTTFSEEVTPSEVLRQQLQQLTDLDKVIPKPMDTERLMRIVDVTLHDE